MGFGAGWSQQTFSALEMSAPSKTPLKVYVTAPWVLKDSVAACMAQLRTRGFDVYDWTTPEHAALTVKQQTDTINDFIRDAAAFVFVVHPTDHFYASSASCLQLGAAAFLHKPILIVDPLGHTRTRETNGGIDGYHRCISNYICLAALRPGGTMQVVPTLEEALFIINHLNLDATRPIPGPPATVSLL
jgi:hypothetical protein